MRTERIVPNIAVGSAIASIDLGKKPVALVVAVSRPGGADSVTKTVGGGIGVDARVNATSIGSWGIGGERLRSSKNLAVLAEAAVQPISESSTLTTLMHHSRTSRRIEAILCRFGLFCGARKWTIFNCFVPIAIGSKLTPTFGALLRCWRPSNIEKPKPAKQEAML